MAIDRLRYGRQSRLPEIGDGGQARLCEARVALGSSSELARTIEGRYVSGFGASVDTAGRRFDVDPNILGIDAAAAQEVAEGALRALVALRAILEEGKGAS